MHFQHHDKVSAWRPATPAESNRLSQTSIGLFLGFILYAIAVVIAGGRLHDEPTNQAWNHARDYALVGALVAAGKLTLLFTIIFLTGRNRLRLLTGRLLNIASFCLDTFFLTEVVDRTGGMRDSVFTPVLFSLAGLATVLYDDRVSRLVALITVLIGGSVLANLDAKHRVADVVILGLAVMVSGLPAGIRAISRRITIAAAAERTLD
ncbi:MAG TPA: hypothetical protein VMQ61_14930 [Thermoanaerobaculia bacterium]|nr:hypothetical protein [Thermoanaerobaculia bacterium]